MSKICLILDNFYAGVEIELNPQLEGEPFIIGNGAVIVGISPLAKNINAIQPGITESLARERAPNLPIVRGDIQRYRDYSRSIAYSLETIAFEASEIKPGKYGLDITGCPIEKCDSVIQTETIAYLLKGKNFRAGKAENLNIAEIAARTAESNTIYEVPPGRESDFIASLPIDFHPLLNGYTGVLREMGISTIGGLLEIPPPVLKQLFGGNTGRILRYAMGDFSDTPRKINKLSREFRFSSVDVSAESDFIAALPPIITQMLAEGLNADALFIGLKYADKVTIGRRLKFAPTHDEVELGKTVKSVLRQIWKRRIRLESAKLEFAVAPDNGQISFWRNDKRDRVAHSVDRVRRRFGVSALKYALTLL
ncbi:MAG: hypothetical protein HQ591_13270 [candidate division Zixibacteria bacterium]|nr:hypothetical protein [Candidatus Tariuqbacter arcticus]